MGRKLIQETNLQNIAAAIRAKSDGNSTYKPREMADAIRALPSPSTLVPKVITENGSYSPQSENADGYSSVSVNVPNSYSALDEGKVVSSGALTPQTSLSVTQNGTFDTTRNNQVTVNVSGGGTAESPTLVPKTITANGTYLPSDDNADGFNWVNVAVPGGFEASDEGKVVQNGALMPQSSLTVTANGTYDTTDKNNVVVNVGGGSGAGVIFTNDETRISSMTDGEVVFLQDLYDYSVSLSKPVCHTPSAGIAGQNSSYAGNALNSTQTSEYTWTTSDRIFNELWIGADFGEPVLLNAVTVAPRTYAGNRQISTVIVEGSINNADWTKIFTAPIEGNDLIDAVWNNFSFRNSIPYRYYRLRTVSGRFGNYGVNGSATFTLYGLGFYYNDAQLPSAGYRNVYWKNNGTTQQYSINTE